MLQEVSLFEFSSQLQTTIMIYKKCMPKVTIFQVDLLNLWCLNEMKVVNNGFYLSERIYF